MNDDPYGEDDLDIATQLQNGLIAEATGASFDGGDAAYKEMRRHFGGRADTKDLVPDFVRRCRDLGQFWAWIKKEKKHYEERRQLIWAAFDPLLNYLENLDNAPSTAPISTKLEAYDRDSVGRAWQIALKRIEQEPDGAITAARTLLETACKHILDEQQIKYTDKADLPKLWHMAAESVNLSPGQHQEVVFKTILGGCQTVVNGLGTLRNRVGDAHGKGKRPIRPKPRHAELAVNLAGTMAAFLIETWIAQQDDSSG